jgi:hypothetical protein
MCYQPLHIVNRSDKIYRNISYPFSLNVPCGKCVECFKQRTNEWQLRIEYEAKETYANNGTILFDTLTYDDDHLPTIKKIARKENIILPPSDEFNISCFYYKDFKKFIDRLRTRLRSTELDLTDKLTYFLCSEYGEDERFTHRPHYHILFFIKKKFNNEQLKQFSHLINECWYYGITDGIDRKTEYKFLKDNVINSFTSMVKLGNYLSKYVLKDLNFQEQYAKRKSLLKHLLKDKPHVFSDLNRFIEPFHRQSRYFGLYAIKPHAGNKNTLSNIIKYNYIIGDGITISLPTYYKRKLFQINYKDVDNKYKWRYNVSPETTEYLKNIYDSKVKHLIQHIENQINVLSIEKKNHVYNLLSGRTIQDYAHYIAYYKGRLKDDDHSLDTLHNHYLELTKLPLYTDELHEHSFFSHDRINKKIIIRNKAYDINTFAHKVVINETTDTQFKYFDRLFNYLYKVKKESHKDDYEIYKRQRELKNKLKSLKYN